MTLIDRITTRHCAILAFGFSVLFFISGFYRETFILIWIGAIGGWWLIGISFLAREEREKAAKNKPPTDQNIVYPGKDLTNVFPEEDA